MLDVGEIESYFLFVMNGLVPFNVNNEFVENEFLVVCI